MHKKKEGPKNNCGPSSEKADKKESNTGNAIMINDKKYSSSRKRKIPAWARGYVKKVHKKKKISFEDITNNDICENKLIDPLEASGQGIDLEKFQEFESEAHNVLNGHMPIFDNTDTENESQSETTRNVHTNVFDTNVDKRLFEKRNLTELDSSNVLFGDNEKVSENSNSYTSLKHESINVDDLSFAFDSDSSLINDPEETDRVLIDKTELENTFTYTVKATSKFPIELLCDTYVQLSRRVGQYSRTYDRKELPKVNKTLR
jgi:hypothetical protein